LGVYIISASSSYGSRFGNVSLGGNVMANLLNVKKLKSFATAPPRVHGNGFIQLDIGDNHRVHFWGHPDIPKQKVNTQIHDHMFDFISFVLKGSLVNVLYAPKNGRDYQIHTPVRTKGTEDTKLVGTNQFISVDEIKVEYVAANKDDDLKLHQNYTMISDRLHETQVFDPTVTLMKYIKKPPYLQTKKHPWVLVAAGDEPDNEFDRESYSQRFLWELIEAICKDKNPSATNYN